MEQLNGTSPGQPGFNYIILIFITLLVIALDQWSKTWVAQHFLLGLSYPLLPWLNVSLQHNNGAAFSLLSGASGWQVYLLAAVAVIICLGLIIWLLQRPRHNGLQVVAVSLLLGGALGNLVDRLHFGHVIDFIDFHLADWHYATFNLADSAITIGVILLMLSLLLTKKSV